jgi:hypothetical protein
MSNAKNVNEHGNHEGSFTQGVGGWAEYTVHMTETTDTVRHDIVPPPGKVIPVIFLPGVMGSNLRMTKRRQKDLERSCNRSWMPDAFTATDAISGEGLAGWFKNATPAQRQLNFDPAETEVQYYHYTENKERFDPDGAVTKASDLRHKNVPDSLAPIPPLLGHFTSFPPDPAEAALRKQRKFASVAQVARWRGWSDVYFSGAYGIMLRTAETYLNNMVTKGTIGSRWKPRAPNALPGPRLGGTVSDLLQKNPKEFGASAGDPISANELRRIADCWYPVHAMGYNFIQSNADSAVSIADRIRGLARGYRSRGFKCDEIIIVTHSMGGLLARALIHPAYGKMLADESLKVLGIYHNVMPTIGAAGAYKRMRFGFRENDNFTPAGYAAGVAAQILAPDGQHATAILANAPAPLEMMPGRAYGKGWLKVIDNAGKELWSWPKREESALESIYLLPAQSWWRLINPNWVNPALKSEKKGGGYTNVLRRLSSAVNFLDSIESTFHPTTFASYCSAQNQASYGEIVFKAMSTGGRNIDHDGNFLPWSSPETWKLLTDDAKGKLTVQAGQRVITLTLQPPTAAGDQTVPAMRSAMHIKGFLFEHGKNDAGYEHQSSYADPKVLASMLYSIVKIAQTGNWTEK